MATANLRTYEPLADFARANPFLDLVSLTDYPGRRLFGTRRLEPEIRMNVKEDANAYHVSAEIPGAKKEDIRIALEGNTVSVAAEIRREKETGTEETVLCNELYIGKVTRSFTLSGDIDEARAEAKYADGILELTLPKKAGSGTKTLPIR